MPRKRSGSTKSAAVNATAEELKTLVGALTSSDEAQRREAVTNVLAREPVLCWHLADRLVDRLAGDDEAVGQKAAASLAEMGGAATGPLILRLHKARGKALRKRLIEVLFRAEETEKEKGTQG